MGANANIHTRVLFVLMLGSVAEFWPGLETMPCGAPQWGQAFAVSCISLPHPRQKTMLMRSLCGDEKPGAAGVSRVSAAPIQLKVE